MPRDQSDRWAHKWSVRFVQDFDTPDEVTADVRAYGQNSQEAVAAARESAGLGPGWAVRGYWITSAHSIAGTR